MAILWSESALINNKATFAAVSKVIDKGLELRKPDLTEAEFGAWADYSQEMLSLLFADRPSVASEYMNLLYSQKTGDIPPLKKVNLCLKYLLGVLKTI